MTFLFSEFLILKEKVRIASYRLGMGKNYVRIVIFIKSQWREKKKIRIVR